MAATVWSLWYVTVNIQCHGLVTNVLSPSQEDRVIGEFLDAAKEETITALRAELARLQQSQHAQQAADSALASLQQKIDSLQVSTMLQCFICFIV